MSHVFPSGSRADAFRRIIPNLIAFFRHPLALAVGLTFAADSLMFGSWVTLIPFVKNKLALGDGALGIALFGMPLGLLLMNPVSPWLLRRFGLVPVTVWSTVSMAVSFALPVWMPDRWSLFGALVLVGMSVAVMNVGMNTCATDIEESEGRKIMSTCHGMWSFGGMTGSALSAALLRAGGFPPVYISMLAVIVVLFALLWLRPVLAQISPAAHDEGGGSGFALPKGDLLLMILIGACTSLCEGVAFDWSAVYLHEQLGAPEALAALGFTAFSLCMMAMRFAGDALLPFFGERRLLWFTLLMSFVALLITIVAPNPYIGIAGYALLGAGVALGAPILFNAAARVPGFAPGAGLATYATFSFMGFLLGPPAIGLISEQFGLPRGFLTVAALTLLVSAAIRPISCLRDA